MSHTSHLATITALAIGLLAINVQAEPTNSTEEVEIVEGDECFYDTTVCEEDICSSGAMIAVACTHPKCNFGPCVDADPSPAPSPLPSPTPTVLSSSSNSQMNNSGETDTSQAENPLPRRPRVLAHRTYPNMIPNHLVPLTVERLFKEIFGRQIIHRESLYWKGRARTDKPTESLLRGTMQWHKLNR